MNSSRIVLVYPKQGMSGSLGRYMPLSLLYTAVEALKAGFSVEVVDIRLAPQRWTETLAAALTPETLLVGVSVMTGTPIKSATEISRWVKQNYPSVPVVWGGPHATFNGQDILANADVDFVVAGYGSRPLAQLALHLRDGAAGPSLASINGLVFRQDGEIVCVPPENRFEVIDYRDIPYSLVEKDLARYGQLDSSERIFPLYSVVGCPYQCAFCSSPAQYRLIPKKYEPLPIQGVVDHIELVHRRYGATYIYFIDDDSFVDLAHVEAIIDEINRRGLKLKLGFRGARVNEIKKMSDAYLAKLAAAGTDILHIGAESGSPRMLELMRKNCTVEDIVAVNQKLARHPEIIAAYNWIVGLPGETLADLRLTQQLMLRIITDHPNALLFPPNKYRPLPGTELYELALKQGYRKPQRLQEWVNVEVEGDTRSPWFSNEVTAAIRMMQVTTYFIDGKIFRVETGNTVKYRLIRCLARLYQPLARLRMRQGWAFGLVEGRLFGWLVAWYRL